MPIYYIARLHLLIALACSALLFPPQAPAQENGIEKARITGVVVDAEGRPVAGAEVRVIDSKLKPVHADAQGRFAMQLEKDFVLGERLVASDASGARMGMWEAQYASKIGNRTESADVRVVLRPSAAIQVKVVDARGEPVPGAHVVAMHGYQAIAATQTNATGAATLLIPDNTGLRHIFAMKPGVGFDYMENFDGMPQWPPDPPPASVTLTLDGVRPLKIMAVGSDGRPVAGVEYLANSLWKPDRARNIELSRASNTVPLSRTTDANGVAIFDYLPSTTTRPIKFQIEPQQPYSEEAQAEPSTAAHTVLTSHVMRKSSLKGRVSLPDGRPAPGIMVVAQGSGYGSNGSIARMRTRKDGTFALSVAAECSYMVAVHESDWAVRSLTGVVAKEGHDRDDLQLQLIKGTLVRGTVRETPAGKPLPGGYVCITELGEEIDFTKLAGTKRPSKYREVFYGGTVIDDAGRYAIRLGPGTYSIGTTYIEKWNETLRVGDEAEMIVDLIGEEE